MKQNKITEADKLATGEIWNKPFPEPPYDKTERDKWCSSVEKIVAQNRIAATAKLKEKYDKTIAKWKNTDLARYEFKQENIKLQKQVDELVYALNGCLEDLPPTKAAIVKSFVLAKHKEK